MYALELTESYFAAQMDDEVRETTVASLIRDVSDANPDKAALVEIDMQGQEARRWTWSELFATSHDLALALSTRFVKGERICVWSPNIPEWVMMEYACALAGLTLVTANPAYQPAELRYVLEQSGASALFYVAGYRGNPMAEIAEQACDGLEKVRERVLMDDDAALRARGSRPEGLPDVTPGDAAQIQYTSGTTGFPKGAVLSHGSLTNNARLFADRVGPSRTDVWSNFMPLFHTAGCGMITLGSMQNAATMVLFQVFDPAQVLHQVVEQKIANLLGVPTMLVAMLECMEHQRTDLSSLKVVISGGSMVAPELVRNVCEQMGCDFQTVYGQTEASPLISQHYVGEALDDICNTIGQPMPMTEISIRDVGSDAVTPVGVQGEICVRGYLLMLEYNDNPEATAATIDGNGWLRTGDLGTMDPRGYLKITGRVKEMIIRGGENLFPAEIENVLLEHPTVSEVAVVGLPDDKWGEIVACFIRPEPGQELDQAELRSYCRQYLSPQKTPVVWSHVDAFPLTGSGKIQKFALRDGYLAGNYLEF